MEMEWVFAQLEPLVKRSPVVFLALVVFFYCPDHLVGTEIAAFRQDHAGVFFLLICLTGSATLFRFCGLVSRMINSWRDGRDMTWFDDLSPEEQKLLADMYLSRQPTRQLYVDKPEVSKLIRFGHLIPCGLPTSDKYGEWLVVASLSHQCVESFKLNEGSLRKQIFGGN